MVSEKSRRIIEIILILLTLIPFLLLGISMSVFVAASPTINFENSAAMIHDLANACITISSIILATILAITAILINRKSAKSLTIWLINTCSLPIFGIIFGLISLFYSYIEGFFQYAKTTLVLSIMFTILGILAIYIVLERKTDQLLGGE